ncbi:MAG: methylated-DNA--[protein]-cysteine S-methyltransferase [Caulobacteraceae bacterium]|nr:methylated-DNA--[protein]-cysteine S-methyltransferase [Caulobacteraceae bacterium]
MPLMPETFTFDRIASPIGQLLIAVDAEARLRVLDFDDYDERMRRLLRRRYGPDGVRLAEGRAPASIRQPIEAYFAGELAALDAIPVKTAGTPFQLEVWAALRTIPVGATLSYGALATRIGRPGAMRAVGLANGSNPIGVVVPCHRVIGADATLTGYGGGIERKRWLLEHEGVDVSASPDTRRRQAELAFAP